jgi:hypothetical protein
MKEVVLRYEFNNWLWLNYDKKVHTSDLEGFRGETCPVARFIKSHLDKNDVVEVFGDVFYVNNKRYDSPKWLSNFVRKFDETVKTKTCKGSTALRVLESL